MNGPDEQRQDRSAQAQAPAWISPKAADPPDPPALPAWAVELSGWRRRLAALVRELEAAP
jgi:hypothetical protein